MSWLFLSWHGLTPLRFASTTHENRHHFLQPLFGAEQLTELAQLIEPLSDEIDVLSEAISSWAENYPSIQQAQAQLLEPLPPIAKASEKAAVSRESSESQLGDRLNKQALKNAIVL